MMRGETPDELANSIIHLRAGWGDWHNDRNPPSQIKMLGGFNRWKSLRLIGIIFSGKSSNYVMPRSLGGSERPITLNDRVAPIPKHSWDAAKFRRSHPFRVLQLPPDRVTRPG